MKSQLSKGINPYIQPDIDPKDKTRNNIAWLKHSIERYNSKKRRPNKLDDWHRKEAEMKKKLITVDDFNTDVEFGPGKLDGQNLEETLKLVGAVDVSYDKKNKQRAIGALVVCAYPSMKVVYEDFVEVKNLHDDYRPGYLAFREAPIYDQLFQRLKKRDQTKYPQVMLVDGNGVYHHRGFGCASHIGVKYDIPTIGVSKNPLDVDGIMVRDLEKEIQARKLQRGEAMPIIGQRSK